MPPSIDVLTSSSAPAWPTVLIALKSPLPSPNVIVPKQSFETRRPVWPSVAYSTMPPQLQPILDLHLNARHSCNCGPHSTVKRPYADLRICSGNRTHPRHGALLCAPWPAATADERQGWPPSLQCFHG